MKKLFVIAAVMFLMVSCNNSKKETTEQEIADTSQTGTNTPNKIDERPENTTDTSGKAKDDTKTEDNTVKPGTGTALKWTKLGAGTQSNMKERTVVLISNKAKFDELWKLAFANNIAPQKPQVDFTKNSVVAVFLGEVTSGGHSIELLSVRPLTGGEFEISVQHTKPGTGCFTTSVMEYPYFFAITNEPISGKPNLKLSTQVKKCE
jgi:hypothetical protein